MLEIQKALIAKGLDAVVEELKLEMRRHKKYPNLVLLKYNQIESPMGNPIVQECRGIILDENKNWEVVCWTFKKFFNIEEGHAAPIDWSTARVFDKVDGSLVQMYWYAGEWHFASSGSPDASGQVGEFPFTFAEAFKRTFEACGGKYPKYTNRCYALEYTGPYNEIVVTKYTSESMTVLGCRDTLDLCEDSPEFGSQNLGLPVAKTFNFQNKTDVIESVKFMNGADQEGYVVCDAYFNRVKVKCPDYVARHQFKSSFSTRNAIGVVCRGEIDEVCAKFPKYSDVLREIHSRLSASINTLELLWEQNKHITDQKTFALAVKDAKGSAILFNMKKGRIPSIKSGVYGMTPDQLMNMISFDDIYCPKSM